MQRRGPAVQFLIAVFTCAALAANLEAQTTIEGSAGSGSTYRIDVPAAWNGSLVLYAHGIIHPDAPVVLPNTQDDFNLLRGAVLARGFAVVAANGASGFLVQRTVNRYGHCDMTQSETLEAFLALVGWVETGAVPAGGDVTR
jgi:hypothetical protein